MAKANKPSLGSVVEKKTTPTVKPDYSEALLEESQTDEERLQHLEEVVADNLKAFYKVGKALKEIQDKQLYRLLGFNNFDEYCKNRWDMGKAYAYRHINAFTTYSGLLDNGVSEEDLPQVESQVRPLTKLPPSKQYEVWQAVLDKTKEPNQKVTAKLVNNVISEAAPQETQQAIEKTRKLELSSNTLDKLRQIKIALNDSELDDEQLIEQIIEHLSVEELKKLFK